jgi:hypothetical protein
MANDPQPSGYLTLRDAFERFAAAWDNNDTDALMGRMHGAFAEGELKGSVFFASKPGEYVVPPRLWDAEGFPDRVFLSDDVSGIAPPGWEPYRGRTPFTNESVFSEWLRVNRPLPPPDPADYDPMLMPTWTLPMTLAWVETRSVDSVRWQIDEWRKSCGADTSSIAIAAIGLDDADPHPMFFRSMDALKKLRLACEADAIAANALSTVIGRIVRMEPTDWAYGELTFDSNLREIWTAAAVQFSRITFKSADVIRHWPETPNRDAFPVGAGPESAPKKRGPKPKYAWGAFTAQMEELWAHYGGLSFDDPAFRQQSQFEEIMATWCQGNWAEVPGESTLREKVSRFIFSKTGVGQ